MEGFPTNSNPAALAFRPFILSPEKSAFANANRTMMTPIPDNDAVFRSVSN
jgi:hypothetical protein